MGKGFRVVIGGGIPALNFDGLRDTLSVPCSKFCVSLIEGWFTKFWSVLGVDFDDLRGKVSEYSSLGGTTLVMCSNKSFAIYD